MADDLYYLAYAARLKLGGGVDPVSPSTLWRYREQGLIRFRRINAKIIHYLKEDVDRIVMQGIEAQRKHLELCDSPN